MNHQDATTMKTSASRNLITTPCRESPLPSCYTETRKRLLCLIVRHTYTRANLAACTIGAFHDSLQAAKLDTSVGAIFNCVEVLLI